MDALKRMSIMVYYNEIMLMAIGRALGMTDLFTEIVDIEDLELHGGDREEIKKRLCALPIWECDT